MYKRYIKRILDVVLAIILLIIAYPFMIVIGIMVKLDSKGPIIFKQKRSGKNGKEFLIYKFRTMEENNYLYNYQEKDKVTRIGKYLKELSLDELPQLFNIIKGEMSFIGPRPWVIDYSYYFNDEQKRRLEVLPGITGLAQCKGRNNISIKQKIKYDIEYVKNISFKLDIYIIFKTIISVFIKEGACSDKFIIHNELKELKNGCNKYEDDIANNVNKVLFCATVDSHIISFHLPYLKYFKDRGYEVHVATNTDSKIPYCDVKHKIPFERSPFKINNLKAISKLKKVIDCHNFNFIHCHTPMGGVITRIASRKTRREGTKVIYTAHGFHFYKGAPPHFWLLFYNIEKYLSKYTDAIITMNKEDYTIAKNKFKKTLVYFTEGVGIEEDNFNFDISDEDKTELRKSLGLTEQDFIMIYPAELSKRKNQIWLIKTVNKIIKQNNNIHLLLPGNDILNGKCQKISEKLNLQNNIHFLGYRKDISKLLKISDIAISSSRQEGLPMNIIEALYSKIPVVATNCRGNRDLIKNEINGYLVRQGDTKDFCEKIISIYENGFLVKDDDYQKKYGIHKILNEVSFIYESIK